MSATHLEPTAGQFPKTRSAVWVVTDQLPYPPRNGITLPLFQYVTALAHDGPIQLVLFVPSDSPPDPKALSDNESRFGPVHIIRLNRQPAWRRILDELTAKDMYQHGWLAAGPLQTSHFPRCRALLVSPFSAVAKAHTAGLLAGLQTPVRVAAVNDCTAAEYRFRPQQQMRGLRPFMKAWLDRFRTGHIAAIERQLLDGYHHVLLQTERDRQLLSELVSPALASKAILAPNGVAEDYFQLPPPKGQQVVFVAELSGEYAPTTQWLVQEVWPPVHACAPQSELLIVGRGASNSLRELMAQTKGVRHQDYVENLGWVYNRSCIALSPVFKGFGLINKTLEAMASALPVVGGLAAFNGIPGFVQNVHGVVCESRKTEQFIVALRRLLVQPEQRVEMGLAARELLKGRFRWESSTTKLVDLLRPGSPNGRV